MKLILQLAKKPDISAKRLTTEDLEDLGLSTAISEGKTGSYVNTDDFRRNFRITNKDR